MHSGTVPADAGMPTRAREVNNGWARTAWLATPVFIASSFALGEVFARPQRQVPSAYFLALCLALVAAAAMAWLCELFERPVGYVLLPVAAVFVPAAKPIAWAIQRGHELNVRSVHAGVWFFSLSLLGALSWPVARRLRSLIGPTRAHTYVALGAVAGLFPLLYLVQPYGLWLAVGFTWAGLVVLVGLVVRSTLARRWLALGTAIVIASVGLVLPERYASLHAAIAGFSVAFAAICGRACETSPAPKSTRRKRAYWALGTALVAMATAQAMSVYFPPALRDVGASHGVVTGIVHTLRRATDLDGDGHGIVLLDSDCAPFDASTNPGAHERSGNAVDENCAMGPAQGDPCAFLKRAEAINPLPPSYRGDIVMVTVDTLRQDDAQDPSLRAISSLASSGLTFANAYSASAMTVEALPALIGGVLPTTLPLEWLAPQAAAPKKPPQGLVVALRELGYATAFVGGGERDVLWLDEGVGLGFDERVILKQDVQPAVAFEAARTAFARLPATKPRFLWLHCLWVHTPWNSHEEYRSAIRSVDDELGKLRAAIASPAMWIFSSDHGDEFYEHGRRYHGSALYVESVHVPLIIAWPGGPTGVVETISPTRSLYPTILAMVSDAHRTVSPGPYLCVGQAGCRDLPVPMALDTPSAHLHGLIEGRWHVIQDIAKGRVEAFDRIADPQQKRPLSDIPAGALRSLQDWNEYAFGIDEPAMFWPYRSAACR